MVDIIVISDAILQMNIIVNGSQYVFLRNVFWNQVMNVFLDCCLDIFDIVIFFQYFFQRRIVY